MGQKTTEESGSPFNGIRISSIELDIKNDNVSKVSTNFDMENIVTLSGNFPPAQEKVDSHDTEIYDLPTKEEL